MQDIGLEQTTGTVVQQGGFMSAANYDMNAQAIDNIGGQIQQANADGSVNQAATAQLLSNLKSQLGTSFTQSTVSNNLTTSVVGAASMWDNLFMMVDLAGIAIISAGAASAAIGAAAGEAAGSGAMFAAGGTTVGAGVGNIALTAGFTGMLNSAMSQEAFGDGSFSVASMFEAGATAMLTAGLTNGITANGGSVGWTWGSSTNSLAALAGVQSVGNALVPTAGTVNATTILTQGAAIAGEAAVQAGVQTALQGGSFLTNLRNAAVNDAAAAGAYAIGQASSIDGSVLPPNSPQYVLAHALLGCAASAAGGTGCASGAIGEATSAALSYNVVNAIDPTSAPLDQGQIAAVTALAMLAGGATAGLLGQNATTAATWAENEALNNATTIKLPGNSLKHGAASAGEREAAEDESAKLTVPIIQNMGGATAAEDAESLTVGGGTLPAAGVSNAATNADNNSLLDPQGENHILYGDGPTSGGHLSGVGNPGKSEFPATWSAQDIANAISDIATDPNIQWSKPAPNNGYVSATGTINGVDIRVIIDPTKGRIVTGYPTNLPRNPK